MEWWSAHQNITQEAWNRIPIMARKKDPQSPPTLPRLTTRKNLKIHSLKDSCYSSVQLFKSVMMCKTINIVGAFK